MGHVDPAGGSNPPEDAPRVIPFGKYLLLDRIAVGGMAEVYTAKSFGVEGFEKILAIKRILPTMAEDSDFISMFIDEAKIAGHLTHANVVPIYELGKIGESHYIAMEYVWGKDLLQIMNRFRRMRRHMPPVMAAWIASKILEGLDYAHRKRDRHGRPMGIIHRDVSPQNCLVSYEGQVKLIDFGIAKAASRNTKTQAGVLKGKFGYMSPEQVRGLPVDHRSDIFAASTCLYEMLTGERLFIGESDFSTLEKVRNADVLPLSRRVYDIPDELERIVLRGLAREADHRWQTAGEMQEELQRFIALSRPPFGTSKLSSWMRTAFAAEIAREKHRLDQFARIAHPRLNAPPPQPRPAAAPSRGGPPPPPVFGGTSPPIDVGSELLGGDEFEEEATMVTASPFDTMAETSTDPDELAEQATQIFFSSSEAERGPSNDRSYATAPAGSFSSSTPAGPVSSPTAPAGSPFGRSHVEAGVAGLTRDGPSPPAIHSPYVSSPGVGPSSAHAAPAARFAPAPPMPRQRNVPTVEIQKPAQASNALRKGVLLPAAAAVLVVGLSVAAAVLLFGRESTGTISVRATPEGADAQVFVDGVARGRAPLLLEQVPEGAHSIEVRADGYLPAQEILDVTAGSTSMIQLAMEPMQPPVAASPPQTARAADEAPNEAQPDEAQPSDAPSREGGALQGAASGEPGGDVSGGSSEAASPSAGPSTRREQAESRSRPELREPSAPRRPIRVPPADSDSAGGDTGTLTINSIPWARVFIDGRDTGRNTPVRDLPVPVGRHTVGLRTSDGTMHEVPVTVEAGQNQRIVRQL